MDIGVDIRATPHRGVWRAPARAHPKLRNHMI